MFSNKLKRDTENFVWAKKKHCIKTNYFQSINFLKWPVTRLFCFVSPCFSSILFCSCFFEVLFFKEIKANPNKNYSDNFYFRRTIEWRFWGFLDQLITKIGFSISCKHIFVVIRHFKSFRWWLKIMQSILCLNKQRRGGIHDTWIRKNVFFFPSLKTKGYEFKTPLFRFVAKKVKKCAFSC
jgi:hypothetical protein